MKEKCFSEHTIIHLTFVMHKRCVFFAVRTEFLNNI
jgi:hypothetical protein